MSDTRDAISCSHIDWMFNLCRNRSIHLHRLTDGCPYSTAHLSNQAQTIPWGVYLDLVSKCGTFFSDEDLKEIGRRSWQSPLLQIHNNIGRFMATPHEQYQRTYGPGGYCERQFPVQGSVEQTSGTQIDIRLETRDNLPCNTAFFLVLAGQMEALTTALGLPPSSVTAHLTDQCTQYCVMVQKMSLPDLVSRRVGQWFSTPHAIAGELSGIQEQLERQITEQQLSLLERESSIRPVTGELTDHELIAEHLPFVSWTMNSNGEANFIGKTARFLGYEEGEPELAQLVGASDLARLTHLTDSITHRFSSDTKPSALTTRELTIDARHKLGQLVRLLVQVIPGKNAEERFAVCIGTEISQQLPESISKQVQQLELVRNLSLDGVITTDEGGRIINANQAACRLFAYQLPELVGIPISTLLPEALAESGLGVRKDRALIPVQVTSSEEVCGDWDSHICIVRDMTPNVALQTERESLERQLNAAQKSDTIGQMTSGIAHDFNNLIAAILGLTDLAEKSASTENKALLAQLSEIRKTGQRGQDMTRQLLNFARHNNTDLGPLDVNDLLRGTLKMLPGLLTDGIDLDAHIEDGPVYLMANHTQIEQVLVNLIVNARDAMPNGGKLTISTRAEPGGKDLADQFILEVRDTGTGMDQQTRERIFEPLFTSKPEGSGTGLGLSVVATIVAQHKGQINVQTEPGVGTSFQVSLPVVTGSEEPKTGSDQPTQTGLAT